MVSESYVSTKGMTLFKACHKIMRLQMKGFSADFGSAFALSGCKQPSIRVLKLEV